MTRSSSTESAFTTFGDGYEYELQLTEDLDDGRYHEELEDWSRKETKAVLAEHGYIEGRTRHIPVHKVFPEGDSVDCRLRDCSMNMPGFC
jgi:hypothetical protein